MVEPITPYYADGKTGRPPFFLHTMLRVHFVRQWLTLADLAMKEIPFDTLPCREFAQLEEFGRLPDESAILRFRHLLEMYKLDGRILNVINDILIELVQPLKLGNLLVTTLIAAPSSTKYEDHKSDPDMHSSKKSEQIYFGMEANIAAGAESGLVHTILDISSDVHDVSEGNSLLPGEVADAFGYVNFHYRGLKKNAAQLTTLLTLSYFLGSAR